MRVSMNGLLKRFFNESVNFHPERNLQILNLLILVDLLFSSDAHNTVLKSYRLFSFTLFNHKNSPKSTFSESSNNLKIVDGLLPIFMIPFFGEDV